MKIYALSALARGLAFAQVEQARFNGSVVDTTGAVSARAKIRVKNEKTGEERNAISNGSGLFSVTNLKPSNCSVIATRESVAEVSFAIV